MADTEELRQMILNFRCSELQVLLGFAGRNKTGRKQELQVRALDLLKLRSTPIQMKIKELHKRFPGLPSSPKTYNHSSGSMSSMTSAGSTLKNSPHYSSHPMANAQQLPHHNNIFSPGPLDYSSKHMPSHHSSSSNTYPVHPDVRFKHLPFFDFMGELLKPASLVPVGTSRFQENNFVFHLTPQQAHDIAISRDMRPNAKIEHTVQVQLRFCLLETSCEQEDNFPPSICVKINGKMCPLPNPVPTNKPGIEPKRPSRPVNITNLCRISPTVSNHVNVSWASEFGRGYAVAVYLVRKLSSATLLQRLRAQGVRNSDHTRALIKEKLSHDADSEIATTSLRVSLMCPLGKMRMQIPCRSSTCTHLQCFDASLYLQMNEKKPTWICPVCDKSAPFDNLVIDGLFLEIFNAAPECNEIQFHEDGSWSPLVSKKELQTIGSIGSPISQKPVTTITSPVSVLPPKPAEKVEVIDLTIDSSDEDESSRKFDYSSRQESKGQSSLIKSNTSPGSTSSGAAANTLHNNNIGSVSPNIITLDSPSRPNSPFSPVTTSISPPCISSDQFNSRDVLLGGLSNLSNSDKNSRGSCLIPIPRYLGCESGSDSDSNNFHLNINPSMQQQSHNTNSFSNNLNTPPSEITLDEVLGFIDRNPSHLFSSPQNTPFHLDDFFPV